MSKKNGLTLRITHPDGTVTESTSQLESVIVGSGPGAAVKISDPKVSNLHVMLKVEKSGVVTAIDLGSEHGTKVGGNTVTRDPVTLTPGDTIFVGGSQVTVLFGDQANGAPAGAVAMSNSQTNSISAASAAAQQKGVNPTQKAFAGTGRNAAALFNEPLPPEATPAEDSKILQVALLWGDTLINVQHFADGVPVTIGEGKENRFHVFSSNVGESFTLAQAAGSKLIVNVPTDAGVVVSTKGDSHKSKEQLRSEGKLRASDGATRADAIELSLHDRAQVSLDNVAFIVRYVRPSAVVHGSSMEEMDFTFFKIASICIMASIALVAAIFLTPVGDLGTSDDIFQNPSKYVKLLVKPEKKIDLKKMQLSGAEEGKKAKDDEGKFGKKEEKKDQADPSKKGAPIVDANKREEDRKKVMQAGLLGAAGDGAASNVFGPGGLGTGINNALGGLQGGAGLGDAHGVGGLGSRGSGSGGGGTGLGLGGLGTKGVGRGRGGAGLDLGGRGKDGTRIIPGKTTVVGGLSKEVIAKVIKRHQNEIKYCYETELQKTPDLSGKVAVSWTIDPSGSVSDAQVSESTMNNSTAEQCMLSKIRRWKFPEPEGGGVVQVAFPWVFKPAGGDE